MSKYEINQNRPDWVHLFETILTEPGKLGDHYSAFHNYSLGNQALAIEQLAERAIPISPIASFKSWKSKGRSVMKGQKAIALWMPVTIKQKCTSPEASSKGEPNEDGTSKMIFVMKNHWFAYSQTQEDPEAEAAQEEIESTTLQWDRDAALETLGIQLTPFDSVTGNSQGYAWPAMKLIAINPVAAYPIKTTFHEMAHCLLHSKDEVQMVCGEDLSRNLKEAEAESVAFLCCAALSLDGLDLARGYVQNWLNDKESREAFKKSAGRVFSTADKILKAGLSANVTTKPEEVTA